MNRVTVSRISLRREIVDTLIICTLFYITAYIKGGVAFQILIAFGFMMAIAELLATSLRTEGAQPGYSSIGCILMSLSLMISLLLILSRQYGSEQYILWIGVVTASDASGLFFGRILGKRKPFFSRKISPNKTYAGYFGEMVGSIVVGWLAIFILDMPLTPANLAYVHAGFIFCAIGDLIGSAAKRELGIKNSDELLLDLPVLGKIEKLIRSRHGYLDCLDSASFALIFYVILLAGCP